MNPQTESVSLEGVMKDIFFRKEDFLIGSIQTKEGSIVKIKGNLYGVEKNEDIVVKGKWETHATYGMQVAVEAWERPIPQTREQVIAFLSSPLVKGCGTKKAIQIVDALGENAIDIISREGIPALTGIKGIGKKRSKKIVESVRSTFEAQKIISELLVYGITATMAIKAHKRFGSNTVAILHENPYRLMEVDKIGFLKADEIARKMGIMPTSGFRIDACLEFVLNERCYKAGHCYIKEEELIQKALLVLNHHAQDHEVVTIEELEQSIFHLDGERIIIEDGCVYPKQLHQYEERLARKLSILRGSRGGEAMSFLDKKIQMHQRKNGMILANNQREAVKQLFFKQMLVLTGGPGTGKTTVVKTMLDVFESIYPKSNIALVAPTGRASRKLAEVTGVEATTIHRLIGWRPGEIPEFNKDNKLPVDLLIIDEVSMVGINLMHKLLDAVKNDTKVLFVGDIDQLPSVSPGNVLSDLMQAGIPTVRLTEVFRQVQESQIVTNAHRINKGQSLSIDPKKSDFYFIEQENPKKIAQLITSSVHRFMQLGYELSDILVLSPMKKGHCGTLALNHRLRERINPPSVGKNEWKVGERLFREGDKVLQTENDRNKDVYNGDMGIVKFIEKRRNKDSSEMIETMTVDFGGRLVEYEREELKQLQLGYAITIHKSQGGEAPVVILPVTTQHYIMLARNLYYTGLTRAKERAVFIGTYKAMDIAIRNNTIAKRNSRLAERIVAFNQKSDRYKKTGKL
ncbi:SF1B family DNA helicase RecD2 [Pseudobacillus badius]|uniref:SF1B family DNA helicase RecD2 n=1 Tax=Bacillus badius TaxID=1455 RepID=UPI001CC18CA0|nr:ATP-dependent RecD-like DNA helicase [Bacillus badius]UAT28928.1 ATP-dependent RecD-like DNA helicase [Bacillus badius]GLY12693.1 ATP-dependent RecD-like DNA helicase [Bacillus badius]